MKLILSLFVILALATVTSATLGGLLGLKFKLLVSKKTLLGHLGDTLFRGYGRGEPNVIHSACGANQLLQCWQCHARDESSCKEHGRWQTCSAGQTCYFKEGKKLFHKYVESGCKSLHDCKHSRYLYPNCHKSLFGSECTICGRRCGYQCVEQVKQCKFCRKCHTSTAQQCVASNRFEKCEGYHEPVCEEKTVVRGDHSTYTSGCKEKRACQHQKYVYPNCYTSYQQYYSQTCIKCTEPVEKDCRYH